MGNLHRCGGQVKIEIETWNLGDIFFFLKPYEPLSAWKFKNTQNKDHPNGHPSYKKHRISKLYNTLVCQIRNKSNKLTRLSLRFLVQRFLNCGPRTLGVLEIIKKKNGYKQFKKTMKRQEARCLWDYWTKKLRLKNDVKCLGFGWGPQKKKKCCSRGCPRTT